MLIVFPEETTDIKIKKIPLITVGLYAESFFLQFPFQFVVNQPLSFMETEVDILVLWIFQE